jgi:hypothetical protein
MPMNWREMWSGLFAAAEDAGVTPDDLPVVATAAPTAEPATADPAVAERLAQAEAQAQALAAQLAQAKTDAQAHACTAFVTTALAQGRIVPAEADALTALYAQAQAHDLAPAVEALIAARPAHLLTTEQIGGDSVAALSLVRSPEPDTARVKKLLALTPDGRAALK